MHPRNIYRDSPPDFTQLASEYPEFAALCSIDLNGKARLDFKNPEAVRVLSKILLKKDFGLDVELPRDSLVPRIPLRLNYILWIEDLLAETLGLCAASSSSGGDQSEPIRGIDVGAGASCVYPLLGASLNGWHFVATEKNAAGAACARENVRRNHFEGNISVHEVGERTALLPLVATFAEEFHFSMCNPPFYDSQSAEPCQRPSRTQPHSTTIAKPDEKWADGGEVAFVGRIIRDSVELKTKVKIYTSMIGIKASLAPLKAKLREIDVSDFVVTTFDQGKTTRWALAWTFLPSVRFKQMKPVGNVKKPVFHVQFDISKYSEDEAFEVVLVTLKDLEIPTTTESASDRSCVITVYKNTWSNARKRRRAAAKTTDEESTVKRPKTNETAGVSSEIGDKDSESEKFDPPEEPSDPLIITSAISVNGGRIDFEWLGGSNKDQLHQLVQRIQNVFKPVGV